MNSTDRDFEKDRKFESVRSPDPDYRVLPPSLLDYPLVRAILMACVCLVIGLPVLRISWETPVNNDGVFEAAPLPSQLLPPPTPPERGIAGALLPTLPASLLQKMAAPSSPVSFKLTESTRFNLKAALDGIDCPGGGGNGLGDGLGRQMTGLLMQLPVIANGMCALYSDHSVDLRLADNAVHTCTLRVRGIVEQKTYSGGVKTGYFCIGGVPDEDPYNIYELNVDIPPQTYYLNAGQSGINNTSILNYTVTIQVKNTSRLTLHSDSIDYRESTNPQRYSAPDDVPGYPIAVMQPYFGQFVQIDAISIN